MTLKSNRKFEEKMTCGFENDIKNLANFYQSTLKSQNWTLVWSFYAKQKMYELKIYRGVMHHDNEE